MEQQWALIVVAGALILGGIAIAGCIDGGMQPVEEENELFIATTTSLYDTGLLLDLATTFEEEYDATVNIIYAGTGKALEFGSRGDVDVMMVHDRLREDQFIADGYGINRKVIAYNYFVIVGPESDPAGIAGMSPEDAVSTIKSKGVSDPKVIFVSRGDASGTHGKEKVIWKSAGFNYSQDIQNSGDWYMESGTGMGGTLTLANEKEAYTLSDIGTFLAYQGEIDLVTLVDEGDILLNIYSAMMINPDMYPEVNQTLAKEWINYMITEDVQNEIKSYRVEEFGRPLFFPSRGAWETLGVSQSECVSPIP